MKTIIAVLRPLLLLASAFFGVFILLVVSIEGLQKRQAEYWPTRAAVVDVSRVKHLYSSGNMSHMRTGSWRPEICVRYQDDRSQVCVARIRFGGFHWGSGEREAKAVVARYTRGDVVQVAHSPTDRLQTVLEPRSSWREMGIAAVLGLLLTLYPLISAVRRRKKSIRPTF